MATLDILDRAALVHALDDLARVLHACVHDGASVGFALPFGMDEARAFWRERVGAAVSSGGRILLAARGADGRVAGTVQLDLAAMPNQRHRAEVSKLLVHPGARRRGIARALMVELEALAAQHGRWLLTLDTASGDMAEPLYISLGFQVAGIIPQYAHAPEAERFDATTLMFKVLGGRPIAAAS
jgi:ribosomal protein S18 acetylase RimI-like enzyme